MELPNPKTIPDSQIYDFVLIPEQQDMPTELKQWLKDVTAEFSSRKHIKLVPIMDCSYGRPDYNRYGEKIK